MQGDLQHLDEVQPPPVAKVRHEREEEDDGEEPMDLATPLPPTSLLPGFTPSPARRNYDESEDEETKSTPMESPTLNPRLIPLPTSRSPSPFSPSLSSAVSDMSVVSTPLPSTSRTRGIGIGMPNFYRPHLGALTDEASSSSPWIPRSSDLMMENTSSFVGQSSAIGALGGLGSPFRDRSGSTATHPSPFVYSLRSYQQPVDSPLSLRPTSSTSTPLHLPPSISTPVYHPAPVPTPRSISTPPHNPTPPHQRPLSTPFHPPPSSVARNVERIEGELEIARRELEEKEGLIGEMKEGVERLRRWLVGVEERRRGERDLIDL
ncbi:hypothetical protein JAAARDRAFT_584742 [Jaapia argillacea MUCL 33604]|uniref:Uncharacterized protein n=1 Tax=Jaapia argillacea MUCL 33604 TaxID=933084 RepID=A0A067P6Q8_9AGAM|nr:hypothetical protein JAAARDRAFT_584742 [Jaapia argillacea MUCL 33604]